ncbi:hypothetical protein JCGZ_14904 [Jatropha curcas]|uniref:Aminotransferase-like plant mobile domain-containing protein n=1 Tax=Jatropha curcas TaxID=180498 RepID=A0A067KJ39_JATCU|nr:hypothetical protein JCGZ_14904 [Jatropha curcas]
MAVENVMDWLLRDVVIDPVTCPVSHDMMLREFIPDVGASISLRHNLPSHLYWGMSEGRTLPSSILALMEQWVDTTYTFHLLFGEMTITLVDFATIIGLPFEGWSVVLNDQLRTLDQPGLRVSLREAIKMEPTISDKRVYYESIISCYEDMPREHVAEQDVDVVA